ncbi:MAG: signal transduction histidine kinase/ActR/RegA family two-component response regulator [Candidatus Promineifilaceae bacterium]|jgi:signal transduction histidine kinase/ActR/RegA family two-component response regulator
MLIFGLQETGSMTLLDNEENWHFSNICKVVSSIANEEKSIDAINHLLDFALTSDVIDSAWCNYGLIRSDPSQNYSSNLPYPRSFSNANELFYITKPFKESQLTDSGKSWLLSSGFSSAVFIPITVNRNQFAQVILFSKQATGYSAETISILNHLAEITSLAIAKTWLFRERSAIQEFSQKMAHSISADDAIQTTLALLSKTLLLSRSHIFIPTQEFTFQIYSDNEELRIAPASVFEQWQFPTSLVIVNQHNGQNTHHLPANYHQINQNNEYEQLLLLPLFSQKSVQGAISLEHNTGGRSFSPEEMEFASLVTDLLNTTLENLSLFDELLRRAQELISLNQVSEKISSTLNNQELAQIAHAEIQNLTSCKIFLLALVETGNLYIQPLLMVEGVHEIKLEPVQIKPNSTFYWAVRELETVLVETTDPLMVALWEIVSPYVSEQNPPENCVFSPMAHGGMGYGFVAIFADDHKPFTPDDIQIVRAVSHQAALGLANSALLTAEQNHVSELRSLFNVTRAMATGITSDERVTGVIRTLHTSLHRGSISVLMLDSGGSLHIVGSQGQKPMLPQKGKLMQSLIGRALLEQSSQYQSDLELLPPEEKVGSEATGSQIALPIMISGEVAGVLNAEHPEREAFSEKDLRLMQSVSINLSSTLENGRLFKEIQEANKKLRALDQLKTKFLANMSHELRTPLNSIIGFSRIMMKGMDGPVNKEQYDDLESIYSSGQHLLSLINDILDLAKLEAGKMALVVDTVDLLDLANSVISTTRGLVHDHNINLIVDIDPTTRYIEADKTRLRQVLLNLLSNAAKFTRDGTIALASRPDDTPDMIIVSVIDDGTGIDADALPYIFEIFEQGANSFHPESDGTGLGLSIVRELIQLHGGKITVDSEPGKGSAFHIHLPRVSPKVEDEIAAEKEINEKTELSKIETNLILPSSGSITKPQAILLVDDDPVILKLYRKYLETITTELISASNGVDALSIIESDQYEIVLIILDLHMPEMDGWETLQKIQSGDLSKNVPIIISSVEPDYAKAARFGANHILPKPIKFNDLDTLIKEIDLDLVFSAL